MKHHTNTCFSKPELFSRYVSRYLMMIRLLFYLILYLLFDHVIVLGFSQHRIRIEYLLTLGPTK